MYKAPKPKIYLGNAVEKIGKDGLAYLKGYIRVGYASKLSPEIVHTAGDGRKFIKIIINPYKAGKNIYGYTHSVSVDTYSPEMQIPFVSDFGSAYEKQRPSGDIFLVGYISDEIIDHAKALEPGKIRENIKIFINALKLNKDDRMTYRISLAPDTLKAIAGPEIEKNYNNYEND